QVGRPVAPRARDRRGDDELPRREGDRGGLEGPRRGDGRPHDGGAEARGAPPHARLVGMATWIGVLALQGAFREHGFALRRLGVEPVEVRTPADLETVEALVIPGGESTTIDKLLDWSGLREPLVARLEAGMPAFGTCAGLIVLAAEAEDAT